MTVSPEAESHLQMFCFLQNPKIQRWKTQHREKCCVGNMTQRSVTHVVGSVQIKVRMVSRVFH